MNMGYILKKSIEIITEYYANNLEPYFSAVDEDILWIGPAEGQMIRGKKDLLAAWSEEKHNLTFSMGAIDTEYITSSSQFCEVLLHYIVRTYYPDGHYVSHDQRLHYTWCERRKTDEFGQTKRIPKILMIHLSNSFAYDERDRIYPVYYIQSPVVPVSNVYYGKRVLVKGTEGTFYSLISDKVMWMESVDNSRHTMIYTKEQNYRVMESISKLEKDYPETFIRIHSSYMVNPLFVHRLKRFCVELKEGQELPIPEKKYTVTKKKIEDWLKNWNIGIDAAPKDGES